jgi:hypothetical protein
MYQQYVGQNTEMKLALLSFDVIEAEAALCSLKSHCKQEILQV